MEKELIEKLWHFIENGEPNEGEDTPGFFELRELVREYHNKVNETPRRFRLEISGRMDRDTARAIDILNEVTATGEDDALAVAAERVWQETGWDSKERCYHHLNECVIAKEV